MRRELGLAEPDYEMAVAPPHANPAPEERPDGAEAGEGDAIARYEDRMAALVARAARRR